MNIKGYHVNFCLIHYISMQKLAQKQSDRTAKCRQHRIFPKNVFCSLPLIKAKHFYGCNFTDTLRNIDVI